MEFKQNLECIKQSRMEDPPESFNLEHAKRRINEVLYEILPPKTTLQDMEDFGLAIVMAVQNMWNE